MPGSLQQLLDGLPDTALVLDVGGWAAPHSRADWVIDLGAWETRHHYERVRGEVAQRSERLTRETWAQRDICAPGPWPFEDEMFDVVICTQTLEDVRDPIKVCVELQRVGRAGYVETPRAEIELTRGIESPLWCGWLHHRWLVEEENGGLVFQAKPHHIHNVFWPAIRSPRFLQARAPWNLEFVWKGSFPVRELIEHDAQKVDLRLRDLAARSARPDPVGRLRREAAERAWRAYRRGRHEVGRRLRAGP